MATEQLTAPGTIEHIGWSSPAPWRDPDPWAVYIVDWRYQGYSYRHRAKDEETAEAECVRIVNAIWAAAHQNEKEL